MNMTTKQRHEYRVEALMQHADGETFSKLESGIWESKGEALACVVRMKDRATSLGSKITKTHIKKRTVTITEEESEWDTAELNWEDNS